MIKIIAKVFLILMVICAICISVSGCVTSPTVTPTPTVVANASATPTVVANASATPTVAGNASATPTVAGNITATSTVAANVTDTNQSK
jgi:hypothetical protein